jgi:AraC family transcriptional regulator
MDVFRPYNIEILSSGEENSIFDERETQLHHTPYEWETRLVDAIREGNLAMVNRLMDDAMRNGTRVGKLSDNELRQAQYVGVVFAHMASRAAIEAGMFEADAYNKSDAFIQKIDKETSVQVVLNLILQSMRDWTQEVHETRYRRRFPPPISACVEYIYNHMHSRITLEELAKASCLSGPYLSALFKKEVGENLSTYIQRQKIKTAEEMLQRTKLSAKDIGYYLNFSSQSYFIACFKKFSGMTPRKYRQKAIPTGILPDQATLPRETTTNPSTAREAASSK